MTKEHTPTPWIAADINHIVKCVNMHDGLVEALKLLLSSAHDNQTGIQEAEEALAKARGETL